MIIIAEFVLPSIFGSQTVDDIHNRMMGNMPDDIDVSEGSHPWNLTYPHAYEKAFMAEYMIPEAIKMIFPMFCEGYAEIMEFHAEVRGIKRKQAEYATGEITITGIPETEIPLGSTFSTVSVNEYPSIDFYTTQDAKIGENGKSTIPIRAVLEGVSGNVAANTIILNSSYIDDISEVTNEKKTTGGIEIESIESLQERILEFDKTQDLSYGGSPSDYKRWALSVPGTGSAVVVSPPDDTTPITIILTDANGNPADSSLCTAVYNHIMQPDNPEQRLAPINDRLSVVPPVTVSVTISAVVELTPGSTILQAKTAFVEAMQKYIVVAADEGEIKYSKIGSVLSSISVINDYKSLLVNDGISNVLISNLQVPFVDAESITLTEGIV